jgi:SET domain-containing protein
MLLVKTSVLYSPIHGLGCFAEEDIPKGTEVWRFDPAIDLTYTDEQIQTLPIAVQEFLKMYAYVEIRGGKKLHVLCGDHARHMNHSESPNLLEGYSHGESTNIAGRDIKKGEELTCNYLEFDANAREKLGPR